MSRVSASPITLTQAAGASAGTATFAVPICGEILEVRLPNAGSTLADGSADFTLTRVYDGSTVLNVSNQTAPFEFFPRRTVDTTAGATAAYSIGGSDVLDTGGGIPIDGYLQVVWAQASTAVASVTMYVHVRES